MRGQKLTPIDAQRVEVHVHLPSELTSLLGFNRGALSRLANIERALQALTRQGVTMNKELEQLRSEVETNTTVDQSAIVLLNSLSQKISELKEDPAKLQAFVDSLRNSSAELAAAVAANTPADPTPVE